MKNSQGRPNFREDIKLLIGLRTAQTAFVTVVTPPPPNNFTFVIFNSGFF